MIVITNRANPIRDLLTNLSRSLLVSCGLATLKRFSFSTRVFHSLDLFDSRDVGNLALEPGLYLAAGQGGHQQQEDNLLLEKQM